MLIENTIREAYIKHLKDPNYDPYVVIREESKRAKEELRKKAIELAKKRQNK